MVSLKLRTAGVKTYLYSNSSIPLQTEWKSSFAEMIRNELASRISVCLTEEQKASDSSTHPCPHVVVHTEVFLLTPDPVNKHADLVLVTLENLSTCLLLWIESTIFNFGDLFRVYRAKQIKDCGPPTLHKLLEDLQEVLEWYELGIYLDIPEASLEKIKCENDEVRDHRCEMLLTLLRGNPQPTWATIVTALIGIARMNLAFKIALKYGVSEPCSMERKPIPVLQKKHDPIEAELVRGVEQLKSEITSKDNEVVVKNLALIAEQIARELLRHQLNEVEKKAVKAQANVAKLIKKSNDIQKQLKLKECELEVFHDMQGRKTKEIQGLIDNKTKEIQKLREELKVIQTELSSKREEELVHELIELQMQHEKEKEEYFEQKKCELRDMEEQHESEKGKFQGLIDEKNSEIRKT